MLLNLAWYPQAVSLTRPETSAEKPLGKDLVFCLPFCLLTERLATYIPMINQYQAFL
jgi:hypothetical protein